MVKAKMKFKPKEKKNKEIKEGIYYLIFTLRRELLWIVE